MSSMASRRKRQRGEAIARWRHRQIEEASAVRTRAARHEILEKRSKVVVEWPSGERRVVSLATLYRWLRAWRSGGLRKLVPKPRSCKPRKTGQLDKAIVQVALRIWSEDPGMSLTFLIGQLQADPELRLKERNIEVSRTTLHRHLQRQALYQHLRNQLRMKPQRTRYAPRRAHEIWHVDAKGPFDVALQTGTSIAVHVMTVLDGATRHVLATNVVLTPNLGAAVLVFRSAARRWGLPDSICCDRASIFDSVEFRAGIGLLGVHRMWTRSRNPEVNGKIEAYHRVLAGWFVRRLHAQRVVDLQHLQELLLAMVEVLYHEHRHRELKMTPRAALNDQVSPRLIAAPQLVDAFRSTVEKKSHPKTGEVDLAGHKYLVPGPLRGRRLTFLVDPAREVRETTVVVVNPGTREHIPLASVELGPRPAPPRREERPDGPLQRLYDVWQGKVRPVAEPGFGLPELLALLSDATQRLVPMSQDEAALVHRIYKAIGPLGRAATERAFAEIITEIGKQRPVMAYLDALKRRANDPRKLK